MARKGHIDSGWKIKPQVAAAGLVPQAMLAKQHREVAGPGIGR